MTPEDQTSAPFIPFRVEIDLLDRMLNFEIAGHPVYRGLEIQYFDDPDHGRGMVGFLSRNDGGLTDVYREPGLSLDPATYALGGGLGEWQEARFDPHLLEVTPEGVIADVGFDDVEGRRVEVRIDDRGRGSRTWASFLAPMGAGIEQPRALPLVWMSRFDLARRRGSKPDIRIGGDPVQTGKLPVEWLVRRRLIKIAGDLCVVSVNPDSGWATEPASDAVTTSESTLAALVQERGGHRVEMGFDPPFPGLADLEPRRPATGVWSVIIDGRRVVAGSYMAMRRGHLVDLDLEVTEGWRPSGLPFLMKVVTTMAPVFRRWPTTYRWRGTVSLDHPGDLIGTWHRIGTAGDSSYRSLTRSAG